MSPGNYQEPLLGSGSSRGKRSDDQLAKWVRTAVRLPSPLPGRAGRPLLRCHSELARHARFPWEALWRVSFPASGKKFTAPCNTARLFVQDTVAGRVVILGHGLGRPVPEIPHSSRPATTTASWRSSAPLHPPLSPPRLPPSPACSWERRPERRRAREIPQGMSPSRRRMGTLSFPIVMVLELP